MKKQHVTFIILTTIFFLGINTASAAPTILTVEGAGRQIPIAVPEICTESGERTVAQEIPRVLARDLDVSGLFRVLNPGSYVETPGKCNSKGGFAYSDWSVIGAEGLVKGTVTMNGRDVRVQLYLHDVQRQQAVLGKEYSGDLSQVPRMAHRFANEIMKFFTGEYGVFGTQIAFSTRVGRFKELAIMDMDGSNVRQLTQDRGLALSASWNPNGTELVYTSYRNKVPDLFAMDLNSKRVRQLTRGAPLDIGAEYAPQGDRILFARSTGDSSDLILINSGGAAIAAVTNSRGAIDVSPSWSPDASQVTFCSNRAGSPQIYTMNSDGSHIKRISFVTSNYCTSPGVVTERGQNRICVSGGFRFSDVCDEQ
jgi:TolB protein